MRGEAGGLAAGHRLPNLSIKQSMLSAKPVTQPMRKLNEREQLRSVPQLDRAPLHRAFFANTAVARPHIPSPRELPLQRPHSQVSLNMTQLMRHATLNYAPPRGTQALVDSDEIAARTSRIAEQVFFAAPIDRERQSAEARE